jgi:hypothetical protein
MLGTVLTHFIFKTPCGRHFDVHFVVEVTEAQRDSTTFLIYASEG